MIFFFFFSHLTTKIKKKIKKQQKHKLEFAEWNIIDAIIKYRARERERLEKDRITPNYFFYRI